MVIIEAEYFIEYSKWFGAKYDIVFIVYKRAWVYLEEQRPQLTLHLFGMIHLHYCYYTNEKSICSEIFYTMIGALN